MFTYIDIALICLWLSSWMRVPLWIRLICCHCSFQTMLQRWHVLSVIPGQGRGSRLRVTPERTTCI